MPTISKPTILFEDESIIVCVKPSGIASQSAKSFQPDMTDLLKRHLTFGSGKKGSPYIGVIHRLDQPVGGVMVYAKTPSAAANLSAQTANHSMSKKYYAVLTAADSKNRLKQEGTLTDFLVHDGRTNSSFVVKPKTSDGKINQTEHADDAFRSSNPASAMTDNAKKAVLDYKIIKTTNHNGLTLLLADVTLHTGRHHQIRVQFANAGCPIFGDTKYGNRCISSSESVTAAAGSTTTAFHTSLGLFAYSLIFIHPVTKNEVCFNYVPEYAPFSWFEDFI